MRRVEVQSWNPRWFQLYKKEAERLKAVFKEQLIDIYHIGSTSVPGLKAKPIIDIMPVVKTVMEVDNLNHEMESLGYETMGENGIPGRRYFQKGGNSRTHHVHVYQEGSPEIERHLAFCNYLRENPEEAVKYGELKQQLAVKHPYNIDLYIAGKSSSVAEIERKALAWYQIPSGQHR